MHVHENRIKELRVSNGLTQKELGLYVGASTDSIAHWEKGYSNPPIAFLLKLANFFGVSVDYILANETPRVPRPPAYPFMDATLGLTYNKKRLLMLYDDLNAVQRRKLFAIMEHLKRTGDLDEI